MPTSIETVIRRECLRPAIYWSEPTGAEIQEVVRLAGFTGRKAADFLGLLTRAGARSGAGISGETGIPIRHGHCCATPLGSVTSGSCRRTMTIRYSVRLGRSLLTTAVQN